MKKRGRTKYYKDGMIIWGGKWKQRGEVMRKKWERGVTGIKQNRRDKEWNKQEGEGREGGRNRNQRERSAAGRRPAQTTQRNAHKLQTYEGACVHTMTFLTWLERNYNNTLNVCLKAHKPLDDTTDTHTHAHNMYDINNATKHHVSWNDWFIPFPSMYRASRTLRIISKLISHFFLPNKEKNGSKNTAGAPSSELFISLPSSIGSLSICCFIISPPG